jgi:hypothetical protein
MSPLIFLFFVILAAFHSDRASMDQMMTKMISVLTKEVLKEEEKISNFKAWPGWTTPIKGPGVEGMVQANRTAGLKLRGSMVSST